jgi:hypothetical protein
VIVLVCGGRTFAEYGTVEFVLSKLPIDLLIEGGALGADSLAKQYARNCGIPVETFQAEWEAYGKRAGYLRNKKMLTYLLSFAPTHAIGVVAFPGGAGTKMMKSLARDAGVDVIDVEQISNE